MRPVGFAMPEQLPPGYKRIELPPLPSGNAFYALAENVSTAYELVPRYPVVFAISMDKQGVARVREAWRPDRPCEFSSADLHASQPSIMVVYDNPYSKESPLSTEDPELYEWTDANEKEWQETWNKRMQCSELVLDCYLMRLDQMRPSREAAR